MKVTKKLFKRVVGLSMSAMMLVSSLNIGAAFASDGRIADKGISDVVAYSTTNLNGFFVNPNGNCNYVDGDHYVMTTEKSVSDSGTSYGGNNQSLSNEYEIDNTSDIIGSLSFDLAGDEANHTTNMLVIAENGLQGSKQQQQCVGMKADRKIGVDADHQSLWNSSISGASIRETTSAYHRIGLAFKQNGYVDVYVDGTYLDYVDGSAKLAEGITRGDKFKFYFTVNDPDYKTVTSDADLSKFYLKNLSWQKGSAGLIAEAGSAYASGGEVTIKFSAPVANQTTDGVKLFESATGAEVADITAKFEDDELKVTLPNGLKAGAEYRVEMPKYKDTIGNTLVNDNVYFNVSGGDSTYEVIDLFETFDSMGTDRDNGCYAAPVGWYLQHRWTGTTEAWSRQTSDEERGKVLEFGKYESSQSWKGAGIYCKLPEKITNGVVSISYDIKPQQYDMRNNYGDWATNGYHPVNFAFVAYANALDSSIVEWNSNPSNNQINKPNNGAKMISGILGGKLGYPNVDQSIKDHMVNSKVETDWNTALDLGVTEISSPVWHTVKMVLDLNEGKYEYYLDGTKIGESATLLATLGLNNGIEAISLSVNDTCRTSKQLIDNIKVTHTTDKSLGESENVLSEDFVDYNTNRDYSTDYSGSVDGQFIPKWWSAVFTGGAQAKYLKPVTIDENVSAEMKVIWDAGQTNHWNNPQMYRSLGKKYTDGVLTVDYDVNAYNLVEETDTDYAAIANADGGTAWGDIKNRNAFNMELYSNAFTNEQLQINSETGFCSWAGCGTDSTSNKKYVTSYYGKKIFGINNGEFWTYKTSPGDTTTNVSVTGSKTGVQENTWYDVRHVIDIDAGTIETYVGRNNDMELIGISKISDLASDGFTNDGIGGIGFSINQYAYGADTLIDNISVTHTPFKSTKGISAVRYNDRDGVTYGSASETTTLIDTIGISFTDAPDSVLDRNFTLTEKGSPDREVSFSGSYDWEHNVYLMELDEYLTAGKTYELKVENVTFGGEAAEVYTHTITSDADGVFEISPITLKVGDTVVTNGTRSLANGDAVKAVMTVTNTTGKSETCALTMGVYKGNQLHAIDFRDITLDGATATGKYANVECTYTVGTDAGDITQVGAFLWDSMSTMKPLRTRAGLNCTNTAE